MNLHVYIQYDIVMAMEAIAMVTVLYIYIAIAMVTVLYIYIAIAMETAAIYSYCHGN